MAHVMQTYTDGALQISCLLTHQQQTMNHIVDMCPLTKSEGGLQLLHDAEDNIPVISVAAD